jgi:peptidoglycan/LPS O-acetylase OafA/YrhL
MWDTPQTKLIALDTLRGLAALSVFIYHFHSIFQDKVVLPTGLKLIGHAGHIGLDMFFVLSGFLIFRSLYLHGINKEYFIRRFLRIAPIYYFSLFCVLALVDHTYFTSLQGLWNILSHLLFLQSFSAGTYYGINPVLWSLSVELLFYLFLPIFFLVTKCKNSRIVIGSLLMIAISLLYRLEITVFYDHWDATKRIIYTENLLGRFDQFAFGILASLITLKIEMAKITGKKIANFIKTAGLMCIICGTGGVILGMTVFEKYQAGFRDILSLQVFLHFFIGLSAALLIFGLGNSFSAISKIVGNRIFAFLGLISYSFYIWHYLIIKAVLNLSQKVDLFGFEFLIAFLTTLAFSSLTYYLIEKRFLAKKTYPLQ